MGGAGAVAAVVILLAQGAAVGAQAAGRVGQGRDSSERARPRLRIGVVASSIRLDGLLDEADWSTADSIANLVQIEPREGATPFARTVVRALTTGDAIIFGIQADDPEPRQIVSFARERDARLDKTCAFPKRAAFSPFPLVGEIECAPTPTSPFL